MPEAIRVGFVIHQMYRAGAEMLVKQAIEYLGETITPTVFCLDQVGPLGEELASRGIPIIDMQRRPGTLDRRALQIMLRGLKEHQVEVIHAHQYTPFLYSALARCSGAWSTRLILTEHGRGFPEYVSSKRRWANKLLLAKLAHEVNACCWYSAESLIVKDGFSRRKVQVLRNGVEWDKLADAVSLSRESAEAEAALPSHRRYVGMVARFTWLKNHPMLIEAFAQVAPKFPDVDLALVGDGEERENLENLVEELGLKQRVKFLGVRADVPHLLPRLSVFALTSRTEAASLSLLEAMGAGVPVIATDVGGNGEIVESGVHGLLVKDDDPDDLAAALERVLSNAEEAEEMATQGQQRVSQEYRLETTMGGYYQLYQKLCPRPTPEPAVLAKV